MNIMQIMKQAQNAQAKLQACSKELAEMAIVGEAGNGAVKVTCGGRGQFKAIKLDNSGLNIDADTAEMLEDLLTVAMKQANEKASKEMEAKMKQATGGLNIPGLNF